MKVKAGYLKLRIQGRIQKLHFQDVSMNRKIKKRFIPTLPSYSSGHRQHIDVGAGLMDDDVNHINDGADHMGDDAGHIG